jgi:formate hydrogenlyase subunit 3/multisubunit Na+/H+ antiporter MnhD subunit
MEPSSFQKRFEAAALCVRSLARALAVAGCVSAVTALVLYAPSRHGSNWPPEKFMSRYAGEFAVLIAMASLLSGFFAATMATESVRRQRRRLWPYMLLNLVSVVLSLFAPMV